MSDSLDWFWNRLDRPNPLFSEQTVRLWPGGAFERLRAIGIVRQAENTRFVTCPHCVDFHTEEVVSLPDGHGGVRFAIPCPDVLRLWIRAEWLRQWTIDCERLAAALAEAAGSNGGVTAILPGRLWRLGRLDVDSAIADLLFSRGSADELLQDRIRSYGQAILLVSPQCADELARLRLRCAIMPLHEAATLGKDGLEIDCLGLQAAVIRVREWGFPESAENASVFRRRGEFWVLAYDGSTVYLADSVGLSYVARLLSEPNRDIPAVALLAARVGIDPRVASGSMGSILDETGRRNYRARYRELQESMAVAAADALVRGIAHFFPSDRRPILTRLWTATTKTRGEVSKMAAAKLDSPQMEQAIRRAIQATSDEIDRRLSEFGDLSGSLPESSASIPTA